MAEQKAYQTLKAILDKLRPPGTQPGHCLRGCGHVYRWQMECVGQSGHVVICKRNGSNSRRSHWLTYMFSVWTKWPSLNWKKKEAGWTRMCPVHHLFFYIILSLITRRVMIWFCLLNFLVCSRSVRLYFIYPEKKKKKNSKNQCLCGKKRSFCF